MHQPKEEIKTNPPNCGSGVTPPAFHIDGRKVMQLAGVTPCKESITTELRPCYVRGKKALFHKWVQRRELISSSIARGGHNGGEVELTLAIVEFENGQAYEVHPKDVQFADSAELFKQFFDEAEAQT